jgi:hypothetical protein
VVGIIFPDYVPHHLLVCHTLPLLFVLLYSILLIGVLFFQYSPLSLVCLIWDHRRLRFGVYQGTYWPRSLHLGMAFSIASLMVVVTISATRSVS